MTKSISFRIVLLVAFLVLSVSSGLMAETKEIICEGSYNMGDGETPSVAESRALLNAKRTAIEQAGTYVESYSRVKNLQMTQDEIRITASGIMEVTTLDRKRTVVGDGFHFWVKIRALVNSDKVEAMARKVKEKSTFEELKGIQVAYDKSQKDIEDLKKQLVAAKSDQKKDIENKIAIDEKQFQANQLLEKALEYYYASSWSGSGWDKAEKALTDVINLDARNGKAYSYRAYCYIKADNFEKALSDYRKAISLCDSKCQAKDEFSLLFRLVDMGNRYAGMNEHHKAIETYTIISGLYDNYTYDPLHKEMNNIYYNRGNSYTAIGQFNMAIRDYDKALAIALNTRDIRSAAYLNRGVAYYRMGNQRSAIADFKIACDQGQEKGCKNYNILTQQNR